ncbi:MAG: MerR family transcriptional regulator [Giesbergeria sp.]
MGTVLPSIPAKRYFTIGEVAELCGVKPHVLRYWEQEFTQLRPMKRRGNRRYYQHHEVLMIRRIRDLLYDQGFTISGARNKLQEMLHTQRSVSPTDAGTDEGALLERSWEPREEPPTGLAWNDMGAVRNELLEIRQLLSVEG